MTRVNKSYLYVLTVIVLLLSLWGTSLPARAQTSIDVVVHYVEGAPIAGKFAYDVSVYFSVLDSSGNPIKDITNENLSLSEDGKKVALDSLKPAEDEPISVVLVLDTSGSMGGPKIEAARTAAGGFISSLKNGDQVAVLSFNTTITSQTDFTTDLTAARQLVDSINAVRGSGTCLYDATYQAVQMTAMLPPGRRAIILLTDGVDELPSGAGCSKYTVDDVINLASQGSTRIPLYTIGLGDTVDKKTLQRLASVTGGQYLHSSDAFQLDAVFLKLLGQLRSQYVSHYTSTAPSGEHLLILQVNYQNAQNQDSRKFLLPPLPYSLSFVSPVEGQEVSGKIKIAISVSGQGAPIKQVLFQVNGVDIGSVETTPYELAWEPSTDLIGEVTLEAIAIGGNDEELARASVKVTLPTTSAGDGVPRLPVTSVEDGIQQLFPMSNIVTVLMVGGVGLIMLIVIVVVVFFFVRKKRQEPKGKEQAASRRFIEDAGMLDHTIDMFVPSKDAFGVLIVLQSDDPAMVGQRIEITQPSTSLGRSANNDIIFPKDSPVSRRHAIIEDRSGQLVLSEAISTDKGGQAKQPTYGTFINDKQIETPVPLYHGDEIRLGTRVRLRFEAVNRVAPDEDRTIDQISTDNDGTVEWKE